MDELFPHRTWGYGQTHRIVLVYTIHSNIIGHMLYLLPRTECMHDCEPCPCFVCSCRQHPCGRTEHSRFILALTLLHVSANAVVLDICVHKYIFDGHKYTVAFPKIPGPDCNKIITNTNSHHANTVEPWSPFAIDTVIATTSGHRCVVISSSS